MWRSPLCPAVARDAARPKQSQGRIVKRSRLLTCDAVIAQQCGQGTRSGSQAEWAPLLPPMKLALLHSQHAGLCAAAQRLQCGSAALLWSLELQAACGRLRGGSVVAGDPVGPATRPAGLGLGLGSCMGAGGLCAGRGLRPGGHQPGRPGPGAAVRSSAGPCLSDGREQEVVTGAGSHRCHSILNPAVASWPTGGRLGHTIHYAAQPGTLVRVGSEVSR